MNKILHMHTFDTSQDIPGRITLNMHNMSPLWQSHDSGSKYGSHTTVSMGYGHPGLEHMTYSACALSE